MKIVYHQEWSDYKPIYTALVPDTALPCVHYWYVRNYVPSVPDRAETHKEYVERPAVVHLEHRAIAWSCAWGGGLGLDDIDQSGQEVTDVSANANANFRNEVICN